MDNRALSARSPLPMEGKPISSFNCIKCADTGLQPKGEHAYHEIYGTLPKFCTCDTGKTNFVQWTHEPAQERKANEARDRLRLDCYDRAKLPPRFRDVSLDSLKDNSILREMLGRYVRDWKKHEREGTGLYFWGIPGCGKTHTTVALCNALIYSHFVRVYLVKSADAIAAVKKSFDLKGAKDPVDRMMRAQLLVIDDLGIENATDFFIETLYRIIDYRYEHKLPTIITSNQNVEMISDRYLPQIASRLREMSYIVKFGGSDRRQSLTPNI